ncbi:MAG: ATP-binding cassette domain-containing protein, partial [Pseudomonadota bacterium]
IPFLDNRRMREQAIRVLRERVGMELPNLDDPTRSYSGGQRQAVAIARAIVSTDLKVLVMDEPTAALGPEETRNTLNLIRSVRDRGIAVILISHNLEQVFEVSDRVLVMRGGRRAGLVEVANVTKQDVLGLIIGAASQPTEAA